MNLRKGVQVISAVVLIGLAACGGTGPTVVPTAPSTPVTTTMTSHPAVEAYLAMWRDVAAAAQTSNSKSGTLDDHAVGEALQTIVRTLDADRERGLVARGAPVHAVALTSLTPSGSPTKAVVSDCVDSSDWLKYRVDTGKLADEVPGGRRALSAEVVLTGDGSWKVSRFRVQEVGSCG